MTAVHVVPYLMGPAGSPFAHVGDQLPSRSFNRLAALSSSVRSAPTAVH